ncbi:TPA: hypothetical protein QDB01_000297 [Burkholderia vietnamiensis]|nr:hypothetical protein [Burkholderia vietnamiensis]
MSSVFARRGTPRLSMYEDHDPEHQDVDVPSLREAFVQSVRLALQEVERIDGKRWVRRYVESHAGGGCMFCGRALSIDGAEGGRAVLDTLIPLSAGGTTSLPNLVMSCTTCSAEKGERDWIAFGRAERPVFLQGNRRKALRYAGNHVLPLSVKGTRAAERVLDARWENPRFRALAGVYLEGGLFAWDTRTLPPSSGVVLALRGFGASVSVEGESLVVVEVPRDAWFDAAWMLIEHNVLLQEVKLSGVAADVFLPYRPVRSAEHQERWAVVLPGVRWEQEARRIAKWSGQAQALQRDMEREELRSAALRPMLDGFSRAEQAIAALFEEGVC